MAPRLPSSPRRSLSRPWDRTTATEIAGTADDEVTICPACRRSTPASVRRCHYCWADLTRETPLTREERTVTLDAERVQAERRSRRRRWERALRFGLIAILVGILGFQVYTQFIDTPSPLPLPAMQERSVAASDGTWPAPGSNLARTRSTGAPSYIDGAEAWRSEFGADIAAPVVADAQRVYVTLGDGRLVALDSESGDEVWSREYGEFLLDAPVVAGDRLYLLARPGAGGDASSEGVLQALDAASGEALWETATETGALNSPVVDGGTVYLFGATAWRGSTPRAASRSGSAMSTPIGPSSIGAS